MKHNQLTAWFSRAKAGLKRRKDKAVGQDGQPTRVHKVDLKNDIESYYKQARGWQYDVFDSLVLSRARYCKAFYMMSGLFALLLLCMLVLLPMRKIVPVVIHRDSAGVNYVSTADFTQQFSHSPEQIKSEIYHFVTYFEGYSATTFNLSDAYVKAQATPSVYNRYAEHIGSSDLLKKLGTKGYRQVVVNYIQLVNSTKNAGQLNPKNEAIVTFSVMDKLYSGQVQSKTTYQAIVTWAYKGLPRTPQQQFMNFDGFTVTSYQVTPLNYPGEANV